MVKIIFTYKPEGLPHLKGMAEFERDILPPDWCKMVKEALQIQIPSSSVEVYGVHYYDDYFSRILSFPDKTLKRSPAESFCSRCKMEGHGTTDCPSTKGQEYLKNMNTLLEEGKIKFYGD